MNRAPNPRLQRTRRPRFRAVRSLRSLGSPLSRQPLGGHGNLLISIAFGVALLIADGRVGKSSADMTAIQARRELLDRQFKVVTKTEEISEPVLVLLAALTRTKGRVLAEPDAIYQETDVVYTPGLPWRRLIFAGNGKGICFVAYEMGGRGSSQHVAVFESAPGEISLVWRAVLDRRVSNLKELRECVRKGEYREGAEYAF